MSEPLEEMVSNDSGMRIPGAPGYYAINGLENTPLPAKVRQDLQSGALRIPEGYVGGLAVIVPVEDGQEQESQVIMIVREPPSHDTAQDVPHFVLPMTFMSMVTLLAGCLNCMMLMPWLVRDIGFRMIRAVKTLTDAVERDLVEIEKKANQPPAYPPSDLQP